MTHIHTTIDIQAFPDRVWTAARDIDHWSEWTATVIRLQPLGPGPLNAGSRAIGRQPELLPARRQVTELDEARSFSWITRDAGILVTERHSIEAAAPGSRDGRSFDFSGRLGRLRTRLTRGLNARYPGLQVRGLKKHAESFPQFQASEGGRMGGSR